MVTEFRCKGKLTDGSDCPEMVEYVPQSIPGVLSVDFELGADEEEVIYLKCEKYGHYCPYKV